MTDPMIPTRPSEPAVNEAAERLHDWLNRNGKVLDPMHVPELLRGIDAALATERWNTAKRLSALEEFIDGIQRIATRRDDERAAPADEFAAIAWQAKEARSILDEVAS